MMNSVISVQQRHQMLPCQGVSQPLPSPPLWLIVLTMGLVIYWCLKFSSGNSVQWQEWNPLFWVQHKLQQSSTDVSQRLRPHLGKGKIYILHFLHTLSVCKMRARACIISIPLVICFASLKSYQWVLEGGHLPVVSGYGLFSWSKELVFPVSVILLVVIIIIFLHRSVKPVTLVKLTVLKKPRGKSPHTILTL